MNHSVITSPLLAANNVYIAYDGKQIIKAANFELEDGQIISLLGPSGCGKSTLLRAIAGFEPLTEGSITMLDKTLSNQHLLIAPELRQIGLVFQDLALFPHLSIADNIRFGIQKWSQKDQIERVKKMLNLVGMAGMEDRFPHSLSGGQQQRIALARAIAPRPKLLLMDEPFSGLDAAMREELVPEVRDILLQEKISAILVTHDQMEAFAIADKVAIMQQGQIQQFDKPFDIYHKPQNRFVANFIGIGKFIPATVLDQTTVDCALGKLSSEQPHQFDVGQSIEVLIRPDDVLHNDESHIVVEILSKKFRGSHFLYLVKITDDCSLYCFASSHHDHAIGEKIGINLDLDHLVLFAKE